MEDQFVSDYLNWLHSQREALFTALQVGIYHDELCVLPILKAINILQRF